MHRKNSEPNVYTPQPNMFALQPNVYTPQPNVYTPQPSLSSTDVIGHPGFRDVTIFYADDARGWDGYLRQHFRSEELGLKVITSNICKFKPSDFRDPPSEVTVALKESHVFILFTTADMLTYMEESQFWLAKLLQERDPVITSVVCVCLNVNSEEIDEVCAAHNYKSDSWEILELQFEKNATNINELVDKVYTLRDTNFEKRQRRIKRQKGTSFSPKVEIIPSVFSKVNEKAVIIFKEYVYPDGQISLEFSGLQDEVKATLINPYNAVFHAPDLKGIKTNIKVKIDGKKMFDIEWRLKTMDFSISSVKYLCQTSGAQSVQELDDRLASRLRESVSGNSDDWFPVFNSLLADLSGHGQFPTLLHWAAAAGLKETVSEIINSASGADACSTLNCDHQLPADMARIHGHTELADFLVEFKNTDDCVGTYFQMERLPKRQNATVKMKPGRPVPHPRQPQPNTLPLPQPNTSPLPQPNTSPLPQPNTSPLPSDVLREKKVPPPLPRKPSRTEMVSGIYESPDDVFRIGACDTGSRGMNELISINKAVANGEINITEAAEPLFNAWKNRFKSGKTTSFKQKQESLEKLRQEYKGTFQAIQSIQNIAEEPERETESYSENKPKLSTIEHLVSSHRIQSQLFQPRNSYDSGRSSNMSNMSVTSMSSETDDRDSRQFDEPCLRRKPESRTESVEELGSSARHSFLALSKNDGMRTRKDDIPPPLPPRPVRELRSKSTKTKEVSNRQIPAKKAITLPRGTKL